MGIKFWNTVWVGAVMSLGIFAAGQAVAGTAAETGAVDNRSLEAPTFREHKATYGLVYRLPEDVNQMLQNRIYPLLHERLAALGLENERHTFNLPHVTVVHLHSADPTTPTRMLQALPASLPPVLEITLKEFYNTEAAKGAGAPWWFDLGVVKQGKGYADMMAFNTRATAALTPLRDGPLPRCTGPVYAHMSDAARALTRRVGVSGVNIMQDGKETTSHNPHNTLVYSMTPYSSQIQAAMKEVAAEMNRIMPEGIPARFKEVSIVEIGFMGNVLREFYRINLEEGTAWEVTSGRQVPWGAQGKSTAN